MSSSVVLQKININTSLVELFCCRLVLGMAFECVLQLKPFHEFSEEAVTETCSHSRLYLATVPCVTSEVAVLGLGFV